MEWLKNSQVDVGCVEIHNFSSFGYGLQATKELKVCFKNTMYTKFIF